MDPEDRFLVYYSKNSGLVPFLFLDILFMLLALFAVFWRDSYFPKGAGIVWLALTAGLAALLLGKILQQRGQKALLLEMDRRGIQDHNPVAAKGCYAWSEVEGVQIWKGTRGNISLALTLADKGLLTAHKKVYISLMLSPVSPELILQKAEEYRAKAEYAGSAGTQ